MAVAKLSPEIVASVQTAAKKLYKTKTSCSFSHWHVSMSKCLDFPPGSEDLQQVKICYLCLHAGFSDAAEQNSWYHQLHLKVVALQPEHEMMDSLLWYLSPLKIISRGALYLQY